MAKITSTIGITDKASSTLYNVAESMDDLIDKAKLVSSASGTMGIKAQKMAPSLNRAITQYQTMVNKQEDVNAKIDLMNAKSKQIRAELSRENSLYQKNEQKIGKLNVALMAVENQKQKLIRDSDILVDRMEKQAKEADNIANKMKDIDKNPSGKNLTSFGEKLVILNQGLELLKKGAAAVGKAFDYVDNLTQMKARLNLVNDGLQTTAELQNMIYRAANDSRGSYEAMANSVAKLGLLAGDAFTSNKEIVGFTDLLNKAFTVSGAGEQEKSSAMYQLTQAMSSGKLQGDEFRSIMENAPMLADAIAKYMGKSKGELKELAAEGAITSDIIKAALFQAGDDINAKFAEMPMTFGQAATSIKNTWDYSMQQVADKINDALNNPAVQSAIQNIQNAIMVLGAVIGNVVTFILEAVGAITTWIENNQPIVIGALAGIAFYIGVVVVEAIAAAIPKIIEYGIAWMAAHWQMMLIIGVVGLVIGVLVALKAPLSIIVAVIGLLVVALAAWKIAQWLVNGAMYACPLVWIIALVVGLIVAIFAFMQWMAKATGLANSGLGMIAGGVNVVIQFFKNLGLEVANIALGIWNALGACADNIGIAFKNVILSIKSWFYGLLETVMNVIKGIAETLNKLPFVDIDVSGLTSKAKEYANKKAEAEGAKEEFKNVADEFNKGMNTFEAFADGWVSDAFNQGAAWGDAVQSKIEGMLGSFDPNSLMNQTTQGMDMQGFDMSDMMNAAGNLPVSIEQDKTGSKEVDISDEDLKMLKDIANRDYMLNYKHITPNVNINFGDVRETADVNAIRDELKTMMENELSELYVVEEA
jgi:tape measure domain-containing protein